MTFMLHVDGARWRAHLADVARSVVGLVPVAKGNGYGFGNALVAAEAARLGVRALAVGTPDELADVAAFRGDLLVMTPWHPAYPGAADLPVDARVVRTVAAPEALTALAATGAPSPVRVVLEGATSMLRFGMSPQEMQHALADPAVSEALDDGRLVVEGLALHLPLVQPQARHVAALAAPGGEGGLGTGRVREVFAWTVGWRRLRQGAVSRPDLLPRVLWVSHLDDAELGAVRGLAPDVELRPRIGTRLWLGDPDAYRARGTVLAVHPVARGQRAGYRQRRAPADGALLVVGGGTSHGVALEAPSPATTLRQRGIAAATGALEASGRARSPFHVGGRRRWFAEPPHMQVSLVWLPDDVAPPAVGDEVDVDVRMTTARFDRVLID